MHLNEEKLNNQGSPMRIVEYIDNRNIVVEFQDEYRIRVKTTYGNFKLGSVRNPYAPTVCSVGISGNKYPIVENGKPAKEYNMWRNIISRCYSNRVKNLQPTYTDVECCDEWLLFENFYDWLHSQPNFDKWCNGSRWAIDKDILVKGNKVYSPDVCCLIPQNVNCLFLKREAERGDYPIGVTRHGDRFRARCDNPILGIREHIGVYNTPEEAFYAYKNYKEDVIKQVAKIEYNKKTINISLNSFNSNKKRTETVPFL